MERKLLHWVQKSFERAGDMFLFECFDWNLTSFFNHVVQCTWLKILQ